MHNGVFQQWSAGWKEEEEEASGAVEEIQEQSQTHSPQVHTICGSMLYMCTWATCSAVVVELLMKCTYHSPNTHHTPACMQPVAQTTQLVASGAGEETTYQDKMRCQVPQSYQGPC